MRTQCAPGVVWLQETTPGEGPGYEANGNGVAIRISISHCGYTIITQILLIVPLHAIFS